MNGEEHILDEKSIPETEFVNLLRSPAIDSQPGEIASLAP
jgi:hypothetical protein